MRAGHQFITYPLDALWTTSHNRKGAKKLNKLGFGVLASNCFSTSVLPFPLGAMQFTVFGNAKKTLTYLMGNPGGNIAGTTVAMTSLACTSCASLASCTVGMP